MAALQPDRSTDGLLQSLRDTLNRTHMSATDLMQVFPADADNAVGADGIRAGLKKLGFEMTDEQLLSFLAKLDKDSNGNVLLSGLERRLTRTGTKVRQRSKQSAAAQEPSNSRLRLDSEVTGAEVTASVEPIPEWLAGEDRHGALTARERRMNSHRRKPLELAPMSDNDFVLAKVKGMLNRRKVRSTDVFKFLDVNGNGSVSREEFRSGLERLGVEKLSASEQHELFCTLDIDNSDDISLPEFTRALKLAEKKARIEGREDLVDTWKVPQELRLDGNSTTTTTDWSKRTLKFDSKFTADRGPSKCLTSRDMSRSLDVGDTSQSLDFDELAPPGNESSFLSEAGSSRRLPLSASSGSWLQSSAGPLRAALTAPIGCGNLHDNYILRQRLVSNTWASHPPSLESQRLPLYKKGKFRRAIAETRWGAEPVGLPDERMHRTRDGCLTASRPRVQALFDRGREKFHAPLLQSVVDSVVFGRDLDFSASQQYDDSFKVKFQGAYGKPSWFGEEAQRYATD